MKRYRTFSSYLKERFGCKVHKISVNAGFSCPNIDGTLSDKGCIFCDNYAFSPSLKLTNLSLEEQIKTGMDYGRKRFGAEKFIVYFQPFSNTYGDIKTLKEKYDVIKKFQDIVGISIGTRPDCIDEEKLELIESYSENYEVWIEYGLQSVHNKTLKLINRNHTYEDFLKAIDITRGRKIKICAHVIIGLPGENEDDIILTAKECGRLRIDGIKIHPLYIVKGTEMEELYKKGEYQVMDMERYIDVLIKFLEHLWKDTVIQRLTADCPSEFLVAPLWIREKEKFLSLIDEKMEKLNTYQGKYHEKEGR